MWTDRDDADYQLEVCEALDKALPQDEVAEARLQATMLSKARYARKDFLGEVIRGEELELFIDEGKVVMSRVVVSPYEVVEHYHICERIGDNVEGSFGKGERLHVVIPIGDKDSFEHIDLWVHRQDAEYQLKVCDYSRFSYHMSLLYICSNRIVFPRCILYKISLSKMRSVMLWTRRSSRILILMIRMS